MRDPPLNPHQSGLRYADRAIAPWRSGTAWRCALLDAKDPVRILASRRHTGEHLEIDVRQVRKVPERQNDREAAIPAFDLDRGRLCHRDNLGVASCGARTFSETLRVPRVTHLPSTRDRVYILRAKLVA